MNLWITVSAFFPVGVGLFAKHCLCTAQRFRPWIPANERRQPQGIFKGHGIQWRRRHQVPVRQFFDVTLVRALKVKTRSTILSIHSMCRGCMRPTAPSASLPGSWKKTSMYTCRKGPSRWTRPTVHWNFFRCSTIPCLPKSPGFCTITPELDRRHLLPHCTKGA